MFTLAKFVSKTISDSDMRQSLLYLPWLPWVVRHKIELILPVLCRPRWPRQVRKAISRHNFAGIFAYKSRQCKPSISGHGKNIGIYNGYIYCQSSYLVSPPALFCARYQHLLLLKWIFCKII